MTTNEVMEQSKEVLREVEESLDRMRNLTSLNSIYTANSQQLDKHWTIIKGIFAILLVVFLLVGFLGATVWYHFQLDEQRFDTVKNTVVIMKERQDFLIDWQKSMQEQIAHIHSER